MAGRELSVMPPGEAERFILGLLRAGGRMTTMEVNSAAAGQGRRCPDETPRFLMKLKLKGIICGEVSQEKRGWVWWAKEPDVPG